MPDGKPEYGEGIFRCSCGSQENVHLLLGSWRDGDFVAWCACGIVTTRCGGVKKEVFNFNQRNEGA